MSDRSLLQTWRARRRPDPPPAQVDLARLLLVGTGLWLAALVVCIVLWSTGDPAAARGAATSGVGILLGLVGLLWVRSGRLDDRTEDQPPGTSSTDNRPGP